MKWWQDLWWFFIWLESQVSHSTDLRFRQESTASCCFQVRKVGPDPGVNFITIPNQELSTKWALSGSRHQLAKLALFSSYFNHLFSKTADIRKVTVVTKNSVHIPARIKIRSRSSWRFPRFTETWKDSHYWRSMCLRNLLEQRPFDLKCLVRRVEMVILRLCRRNVSNTP